MKEERYTDGDDSFTVRLPEGWDAEADPDGGLLIAREEGVGLLHIVPFAREPYDEPDPAEELYAFLEEQDIELEEDEVEDVELGSGGALALCEYLAEDGEELSYWLVAVATAPGRLLFASYSCPAGEEERENEAIRALLSTLRID